MPVAVFESLPCTCPFPLFPVFPSHFAFLCNYIYIHGHIIRAPLESVSLCTRFSGFSTISSFGFNRLSSKLVDMFFGIVPMFVYTNGFCSGLLRRADMRKNVRARRNSRISARRSNPEQKP